MQGDRAHDVVPPAGQQAQHAGRVFRIVGETSRSQAATMVLKPGASTGGDDNVHKSADQWLYVVSGRGRATVEGRAVTIQRGSLLLIAAGERHEIRNDGAHPLVTINVYAPPVFETGPLASSGHPSSLAIIAEVAGSCRLRARARPRAPGAWRGGPTAAPPQ